MDYRLGPGGAPTLEYPELRRAVEKAVPDGRQPTLAEVAAVVRQVRQAKGMLLVEGDPDCRSAGSFFKNPVMRGGCGAEDCGGCWNGAAGVSGRSEPGMVKVPAAWLIEKAGFSKGYSLGAAGISSRHTLALINRGGATAAGILELAREIAGAVVARFGIELERSRSCWGSDPVPAQSKKAAVAGRLEPDMNDNLHQLRCFGCGARVAREEAKPDFRCSVCGDLFEVEYPGWGQRKGNDRPNAGALKWLWRERRCSSEALDHSGVWRFRELLPILDSFGNAVTLREGNTPLYHLTRRRSNWESTSFMPSTRE